MEFSRQEYWSRLPFPSLGDFPDPEIEPTSLVPPALAGRFFTCSAIREALSNQGATQLPPALDRAQPTWCLCPGSSSRSHVTLLHIYIPLASRLSSLTLPPGSLLQPTHGGQSLDLFTALAVSANILTWVTTCLLAHLPNPVLNPCNPLSKLEGCLATPRCSLP